MWRILWLAILPSFVLDLAVVLVACAALLSLVWYFSRKHRKRIVKQREVSEAAEERQSPAKLNFDEIKETMLTGPDAKEKLELMRTEAYLDRPTQKLLRNLLENGKGAAILPTYDLSFGFRYKSVESVFDEDLRGSTSKEVEDLLIRLNHLGILEKSFFDTVSACPNCGSTSITLHYRCPKCASRHVVQTGLTEHIPCGNIDERDKYNQKDILHPTCPKCGATLAEGQYRDMGLWYVCRECGEKFEHTHLDMVCRKCNNQFTIQTALVREISKYALDPTKENEIRQNVTSLESLNELLTELGFTVEMPASVIGEKTGIQHSFSLIAKKKSGERETIVAVDHAVGDIEVSASSLILYTYKISEVEVDLPIFVAIPKLSDTAKRIAEGYNLLVIEGIPQEKEQLAMLRDVIPQILSKRIEERPTGLLHPQEIDLIHQWIIRRGKRVDVWRDRDGRFVNARQDLLPRKKK
jgi:predicted RNA-binding Zn-ribbon protein involved in translation (DUF1610 family)